MEKKKSNFKKKVLSAFLGIKVSGNFSDYKER